MDNNETQVKKYILNQVEECNITRSKIDPTIAAYVTEITKHSGEVIYPVDNKECMIQIPKNLDEIILIVKQIFGYGMYLSKSSLDLYDNIIEKYENANYSSEKMSTDYEMFNLKVQTTIAVLNQARQFYGSYLSHLSGVAKQKNDHAKHAGGYKNKEPREWIIQQLKRLIELEDFGGYEYKGKINRSKFARDYTLKVNDKYKDVLNTTEKTVKTWIKNYLKEYHPNL